MNRKRYERRVRDDAQTWRDRLIAKRIVTSDTHVAAHEGWKCKDMSKWEPRVYFCQPVGQGLEKDLQFEAQQGSLFLKLPAEIRNKILEYLLPPQIEMQQVEVEGLQYRDATWTNTSAIIFTCKQLYIEGRAFALHKHTFPYEQFPRRTRWIAKRVDNEYVWDLWIERDM